MTANPVAGQDIVTVWQTKGEHTFKIYHKLDCHSAWVIYMIVQNLQTTIHREKWDKMQCNIRFNDHQSHIRTSKNSCKLSEHFHFRDVTIVLIK